MIEEIENMIQNTGCYGFECSDLHAKLIEEICMRQPQHFGVISTEDCMYEHMRVEEYITFFANLSKNKNRIEDSIKKLQLNDIRKEKISKLNIHQKILVACAREDVLHYDGLYMHEPFKNVDETTLHIVLEWIEEIIEEGKNVVVTSTSFKDICLLPNENYSIDNNQHISLIDTLSSTSSMDIHQPMKVSARLHDKIVLFHPNEIDYVESLQGKNYFNVRNESFASTQTLDELETSLSNYGFFRCHRSYLVNMQKVQEITKWTRNSYSLKLEGSEEIRVPLSKGRLEDIKRYIEL